MSKINPECRHTLPKNAKLGVIKGQKYLIGNCTKCDTPVKKPTK